MRGKLSMTSRAAEQSQAVRGPVLLSRGSRSLCRCKLRRKFIGPAQSDPAMLSPMAQANEPVVLAGRPYAQPEACQFGIPDAAFGLAQRQLAPRKGAIRQCPAPGLSPLVDNMAFSGMPSAEQSQHLSH
ncbi:MAG: hypothetical protein H2049_06895 [Porphyrobacter sp.]|nr:hypothetical protein [Porphyrobacter sp.]